jgi:uncharacterized protein YigE (DUF2233 family)
MTCKPILCCLLPLTAVFLLPSCKGEEAGEPLVRAEIRSSSAEAPAARRQGRTGMESACRSTIFENTPFTHCVATPTRHTIRIQHLGGDGAPLRSFRALVTQEAQAENVAFALNGGMVEEDGNPVGYLVQDGERLQTLDRVEGEGDFYLLPNGVFYGTDESWEVRTAESFEATVRDRPQFGTQSGPMLVIDGALHPAIAVDGASRLIRNAVGVDADGQAHFVISNAPVSLGKLARLYRDKLDVMNALHLDGTVSSLWNPAAGRMDEGAQIGPIIVVEKRPAESTP